RGRRAEQLAAERLARSASPGGRGRHRNRNGARSGVSPARRRTRGDAARVEAAREIARDRTGGSRTRFARAAGPILLRARRRATRLRAMRPWTLARESAELAESPRVRVTQSRVAALAQPAQSRSLPRPLRHPRQRPLRLEAAFPP